MSERRLTTTTRASRSHAGYPIPASSITSPPSLPSSPGLASPTPFMNPVRVDVSPSLTSLPCPNVVVISLSTHVTIPNFRSFYDTPIDSFYPTYYTLPDGSLMAPPLAHSIKEANILMLMVGALLMLTVRNIIVSIDYIRRGRVKYKMLLYVLLASQLCGPIAATSILISSFVPKINCDFMNVTAGVFADISYSLLLTGILGIKAYRCLDSSKPVLVIIISLQIASSALIYVAFPQLQSIRTLSGRCGVTGTMGLVPIAIVIRFLEALFICSCFFYALWKSSMVAQGRISISLSQEPSPPEGHMTEKLDCHPPSAGRRGWWDYVPEDPEGNPLSREPRRPHTQSWMMAEDQTFLQNLRLIFSRLQARNHVKPSRTGSKPSLPDEQPDAHHSHVSVVGLSTTDGGAQHAERSLDSNNRATSPTPSAGSRLNRLMTQMPVFREVMRTELAHTALITLTSVVAAILGVVGVFDANLLFPSVFLIAANWAILSLLVIHNFGRVVARHEREAILQHPSAWDPMRKADRAINTTSRLGGPPRAWSPVSIPTRPHTRHSRPTESRDAVSDTLHAENPFEDFECVGASDDEIRQPSWMSLESLATSAPSSPANTVRSFMREAQWKTSDTLPSPVLECIGTSGQNSPSAYADDRRMMNHDPGPPLFNG